MKKPNTWAEEISRNLPHLKIINRVKPKDVKRKEAPEDESKTELAIATTALGGIITAPAWLPYFIGYFVELGYLVGN